MTFATFDRAFINFAIRFRDGAAFFSLAIVYGWFGILKVFGLSPASALVLALLDKTMPWFPPHLFMPMFGAFEVLIALLFCFPVAIRWAIGLMGLHMVMVFLPLILLPGMTWSVPFVPTLEGQYILKNVVLLALALGIVGATPPIAQREGK
jgi:hypothetical protein